MSTTYEYTIAEFPNNKADLTRLTREIRQSTIASAELEYINYEPGYKAWIVFDGDLSPADQSALDIIVQNHSGDSIIFQSGLVAESTGVSVTSAGEYTDKVVLLPGELLNGKYRIHFYCEVGNTNTSGRTEVNICVDGECFANPSVESEDKDDWIPFSGFNVVEVDEENPINEVKLQYRRQNKGSAKIRNAILELFKMESL